MADKDKVTLKADLETTYSDNITGDNTPAGQRGQQTDIIDSFTLEADAIAVFSFAAYGGLSYSGAPLSIGNFGAGWDDIADPITNTLTIANPRGVTPNLLNGTLTVDFEGVYLLTVSGSFSHNESQSGRITNLRLFNTATQTGGHGLQIGIGRNVGATNFSVVSLVEFPASSIGQPFVLQIGGGDVITDNEMNAYSYNLTGVGEFRGELGAAVTADYLANNGEILTNMGEALR